MASDADNVPIESIPSTHRSETVMKKRILCAAGAILITSLWSVGMLNATAQYRQTYITPLLATA